MRDKHNLATKLVSLLSAFVAVFAIFAFVAYRTLNHLRVNGPVYDQIVQGKDLIADILPPPAYIMEAYLVTLQMLGEMHDEAKVKLLIKRGNVLKNDYLTRHEYWQNTLPEGQIKDALIKQSYIPAMAFFDLWDNQFIPAIQKGDKTKATELAFGVMFDQYEIHRKAIDEVVILSAEQDTRIETMAESIIKTNTMDMALISVFGILGLCLLAFAIVRERKRVEDALFESENKYRLIAENTADLISTLDMNLNFTYISPSIMRLRGFTVEEAMKQTLDQVLTPESMSLALDVFEKEMLMEDCSTADPNRTRMLELEEYKKDGTTVWMEVSLTFLRNKDRKPVGILTVSRDITERKQAEKERENLYAQLFQAQKMESVGRLAGGVAHDFNNMLSAILGHVQLAIMQCTPSEHIHAHLKVIEDSAHRSADLTRQLLAFARKQTIAPKVLDINDTVSGMLKMLRRLIGEDIDLVWRPKSDLWQIKIDPSQIDQLLANLCVNARDSITGVGKVTIETENITFDNVYCAAHPGFSSGEYVMLSVSDNGCGMDKKTLPHIFEPFFTTKEVGKGTGLGLSTVYGIVKQNNGFINVYSEPDKGTTFKIYLPRVVGEAIEPSVESETGTPKSRGETVLVVDDEPMILNVSRKMLEQLGYVVLIAASPGEAIRIAKGYTKDIHLLITDVVMPGSTGRDLAKNIVSLYPTIRLLFMSGYTSDIIAHHGTLDEGINFVQKPFSIQIFGAKVREALDRNHTFL